MCRMKKRSDSKTNKGVKLKERHTVVWTQEEDDILREQIRIYGTDNSWTIVASKFNDKTTRQCRRRWYTYLNCDFKKGGWTPEEDVLLCEAQRKYGNKWTEIAKMVSGRTDNAIKNRFSTLCKKQAKCKALVKENKTSLSIVGKKRILLQNEPLTTGTDKAEVPYKKMRQPDLYEESSGSSDYSTASTLLSHTTEGTPTNHPIDLFELNQDTGIKIQKFQDQKESEKSMHMFRSRSFQADGFTSSQERNIEEVVSAESAVEFGSPLNVTSLFPDESTEIPSPQFSENERKFLMKVLGMETAYPHPATNQSEPKPVCKRVLLHNP